MKNLVIVVLLMVIGFMYVNKEPAQSPGNILPIQVSELQIPHRHGNGEAHTHETTHETHNKIPSLKPETVVTQVTDDGDIQQHDGDPHHAQDAISSQTNDDRWKKVKSRLCLESSPQTRCIVDNTLDIQQQIIDSNSGNAKAIEISLALTATDFDGIKQQLGDTRESSEAYQREQDFNDRIYDILSKVDHVQSNGLVCGDVACVASFVYNEKTDWHTFGKQLFAADAKVGSLFSYDLMTEQDGNTETRIMFLPNHLTTIQ